MSETTGTALRCGGPREVRMPPSVVIERAVKRYGDKLAIDDVSLTVAPGSFLVLLGPSGSGKTTLLRSIAGIERLSSGRIAIGDVLAADDVRHLPPERRDLAMVFQDYALWPHLTAQQNVAFALRRRRLARNDAEQRSRAMLDVVGLGHLAERYPNQLSGGEQQRVALARALVADVGLLLFDEPLSNLDANLREQMRIEIGTLARESGATCIYITHDQAEAFALADVIGVLQAGRLVQCASPEDLYARPVTPFVARFTGLAGEFEVEVARAGPSGAASVRVIGVASGPQLPAQIAVPVYGRHRGRLLVRPAAVRLVAAEDPAAQLRARVSDAAFRGRGYDYAVAFDGGTKLVGIRDDRRWERGAVVGVNLDSEGCLLFPEEPSAANAAPSRSTHPAAAGEPVPGPTAV